MLENTAKQEIEIHELMRRRWSPKDFDPDKAISREKLRTLLEAARWAPSSYNEQPWRFIVSDRAVDPVSWRKALDALVEQNREWARNAPVLILAIAIEHFAKNGQFNRCAQYDTGAASLSLALQATALGLVTHQMGGFDADKARLFFNLPEACQPMAMIAVGYQSARPHGEQPAANAQFASRARAPIEKHFFSGEWGKGIE